MVPSGATPWSPAPTARRSAPPCATAPDGSPAAAAARLTDLASWVRRHAVYALREFGMEGRHELERIAHGSPDPYARDMTRELLEDWSAAA